MWLEMRLKDLTPKKTGMWMWITVSSGNSVYGTSLTWVLWVDEGAIHVDGEVEQNGERLHLWIVKMELICLLRP
jgi:hypothetical protein